ncbi:VWA domain-containing protein [Streptomyces daliensis]
MDGTPGERDERTDGAAAPTSGAGAWQGPSAEPAGRHTRAVVADRSDRNVWGDLYARSAALRELARELNEHHDDATGLLSDVFLAAYQAAPRLRERAEMAPSRLARHRIVTSLVASPEFAELRRETVGDPYAAAMAVLARATELRRMLERSPGGGERAARAPRARRGDGGEAASVDGAAPMGGAHQQAADGADMADDKGDGADEHGAVPPPATPAPARQPARGAAPQAPATTDAAPGHRAATRNAAAKHAAATRHEAALTRTWGFDAAELERLPWDQRARLAERLRTGRLAQWAELIGRFRRMAGGERARKVENTAGELIGVTLGDDLSRVIPSELAHLGLPALRAVFAARYAAGELMLYDHQGEQNTGRGAIVACVDTSHSMYAAGPGGVTREAWAKACALALLDQARHARRDFVGILFSAADKLQVFRFPAGRPAGIAEALDFAETFLGGGTSYQSPLTAAGELLEEEFNDAARTRGDIVLITDDECGVTEEWMRGWNDAKRLLGFRVFGVAIGAPRAAETGSVLESLCDNLRTVEDLTDVRTAADLFRVI